MTNRWGPGPGASTVTYTLLGDSTETWGATGVGIASFQQASVVTDFGLVRRTVTPFGVSVASTTGVSSQSWPNGQRSIDTMASHLRVLYATPGVDLAADFQYHVDFPATWWVVDDNAPPLNDAPFSVPAWP